MEAPTLAQTPEISTLRRLLEIEVIRALNLPQDTWLEGIIKPLYSKGCQRFAEIGVKFDCYISEHGFHEAARLILPEFIQRFETRGTEKISPFFKTCPTQLGISSMPLPENYRRAPM